MWDKILKSVQIAAWASIIFFFIPMGIIAWRSNFQITPIISQLTQTLTNLNNSSAQLNITLSAINDKKTGTMALVNDDFRNLRVELDNINSAAIYERLYFQTTVPEETKKVDGILDNLDSGSKSLISKTDTLLSETTKTEEKIDTQTAAVTGHLDDALDSVKSTVSALTPLINQTRTNLSDLDTLEIDPSIKSSVKNTSDLLGNTSEAVSNFNHPKGIIPRLLNKLW